VIRKLGTIMPVHPSVVRLDIPLQDVNDLPQIARYLTELSNQLRLLHQAEHLNSNAKLFDAYGAIRSLNTRLKKEYPK
jgi:hypothetical protein